MSKQRVLSGMRVSGALHLGHYHGVLKNWLALQRQADCIFLVADWHGLTTEYADRNRNTNQRAFEMVVSWLACGIDPEHACIALQSRIPEHAILYLLLGMLTPLSWLERVPTYKDQQQKLQDKDLSTYGFLGYPLLQAADILLYQANQVPVGEDQLSHIEFAREIARRFNHLYGHDVAFEQEVQAALAVLGPREGTAFIAKREAYQMRGDQEALHTAQQYLTQMERLSTVQRSSLMGYLEGKGRQILTEPEALLTPVAKMPGLDGQKMSKSYHNTIPLNTPPKVVENLIRKMPTDPARVRRSDPGTPEKCPVWSFHQVYSNAACKAWVQEGCTQAKIGCLECKQPVIDAINTELEPIRAKIETLTADPTYIHQVMDAGTQKARKIAAQTLEVVEAAMG